MKPKRVVREAWFDRDWNGRNIKYGKGEYESSTFCVSQCSFAREIQKVIGFKKGKKLRIVVEEVK